MDQINKKVYEALRLLRMASIVNADLPACGRIKQATEIVQEIYTETSPIQKGCYVVSFSMPGAPRTKKNSQRMFKNKRTGKNFPVPSAAFEDYQEKCLHELRWIGVTGLKIDKPVNVSCVYYMPTKGAVDLNNLLEATCDILVEAGVLTDDKSKIVASHDGSRVRYDKERPRVDIIITEVVE